MFFWHREAYAVYEDMSCLAKPIKKILLTVTGKEDGESKRRATL